MDLDRRWFSPSRASHQQHGDECHQPFHRSILPSSANAPGPRAQISRSAPSIALFLKSGPTCDGSGTRWVVIVTGTSVTNKTSTEARVIQPQPRVVQPTNNTN